MTYVNKRKQTRAELVAEHLRTRGHISEGSALVEYGRFRLGDAIYRLRNEKAHLLPKGTEIVTIHKTDTQGNPYGEYHLVPKAAAAARAALDAARSQAQATATLQGDHAPGD